MERCEGLGRCELTNVSLQHLSLADCPNLHTLSLTCPALLCLNLEECKLLSQVSLQDWLLVGSCCWQICLKTGAEILGRRPLVS